MIIYYITQLKKVFYLTIFFYLCFIYTYNPIGYNRSTPYFSIYTWPKNPYFIASFAFSHHNLFVTFEISLLSLALSFYYLVSKLIFSFLIIFLLPLSLFLSCSFSIANFRIF